MSAVLHGGVMNEGALLMPQFVNNERQSLKHLGQNFESYGPHFLLRIDLDQVTEEDTATAELLIHEYLSEGLDQNITTVGNALHMRDALTDLWFLMPIDNQVKLISQKISDTYYYNYR